jgi:molybdopterin adenylyltransferase
MNIRVAVLTVSDRSSSGQRPDLSGPALQKLVQEYGWQLVVSDIVPDEQEQIQSRLVEWADSGAVDLILTTGGTGFSRRDVTPEATLAVCQRLAPGLAEAMRTASLEITPHAMLSRAVAGIRGVTLIVNLPGSPKAAGENLTAIAAVLPHAVQLLRDDPDAESSH